MSLKQVTNTAAAAVLAASLTLGPAAQALAATPAPEENTQPEDLSKLNGEGTAAEPVAEATEAEESTLQEPAILELPDANTFQSETQLSLQSSSIRQITYSEGNGYNQTGFGYYVGLAVNNNESEIQLCVPLDNLINASDYSYPSTVVLPSSVQLIKGVKSASDSSTTLREIGGLKNASIKKLVINSDVTIESVQFSKYENYSYYQGGATPQVSSGKAIFNNCVFQLAPIVDEGATAVFNNCTFENGISNEGSIVFESEEAKTSAGTISGNGSIKTVGSAEEGAKRLLLSLANNELGGFVVNKSKSISFTIGDGYLSGDAKADAVISAVLKKDNECGATLNGLAVTVNGRTVTVGGAPTSAGLYTLQVTASNPSDETDYSVAECPIEIFDGVYNTSANPNTSNLTDHIKAASDINAFTIVLDRNIIGDGASITVPNSITKIASTTDVSRTVADYTPVDFTFASDGAYIVRYLNFTNRDAYHTGSTVKVPKGAQVSFEHCVFAQTPVVENGAKASFVDCTFLSNKIDNRGVGNVTFEGCTPEAPTNIGASGYVEAVPMRLSVGDVDGKLGGSILSGTDGVPYVNANISKGAVFKRLPITLEGDNADSADVTVSVKKGGSASDFCKLQAVKYPVTNQETDTVSGATVGGKPYTGWALELEAFSGKAGDYTLEITATATPEGKEAETKKTQLRVFVNEELNISLEGNIQAFKSETQTKAQAAAAHGDSGLPAYKQQELTPLALMGRVPLARSMGGLMLMGGASSASSASGGGTSYTNPETGGMQLGLFVQEGADGAKTTLSELTRDKLDANGVNVGFDVKREIISLDGNRASGLQFDTSYDNSHVTISDKSGEYGSHPNEVGTYKVRVTVTDSFGRVATAESDPFRIYPSDATLDDLFELFAGEEKYDAEPYFITALTRNASRIATLPITLKELNGSHERGVYSEIGYAGTYNGVDYTDSEKLVVPTGADVTINNVKFLSSVRIEVQPGAKLTLEGCVVYGQMDVYGTLSTGEAGNGFTTTNVVNMMPGSTLDGAKITSHGTYLWDGNTNIVRPDVVVVTQGDMTVAGAVEIQADASASDERAQDAFVVYKGTVTLADGSTLKATGGYSDFIYFQDGGNGISMYDGTKIAGAGAVEAIGGYSYSGNAGAGIGMAQAGKSAIVDVARIVATGGAGAYADGRTMFNESVGNGGDAIAAGVKVRASEGIEAAGGKGLTYDGHTGKDGSGDYELYSPESNGNTTTGGGTAVVPSTPAEPTKPAEASVEVVDAPDGSAITKTVDAAGSTSVVITDTEGMPASAEVVISENAQNAAGAAKLPVVVPIAAGVAETIPVSINAPAGTKVSVPVTEVAATNPGAVVVVVHADGTEEPLAKCAITEDGAAFTLSEEGVSIKVVDNAIAFPDLAESDWFDDVAAAASARGIISGVQLPNGGVSFEGNAPMSRGMLAQALRNIEGGTAQALEEFSDVASDAWYAEAISWAHEQEIMQGIGGARMAPEEGVTREQEVLMLMRYAESLGLDTSARADLGAFSDAAGLTYGYEAMQWAVAAGLVHGYTGTNLLGGGNVATRAETCSMLLTLMELLA